MFVKIMKSKFSKLISRKQTTHLRIFDILCKTVHKIHNNFKNRVTAVRPHRKPQNDKLLKFLRNDKIWNSKIHILATAPLNFRYII